MMKERLHETATGPLRGAARGPCATPSKPSPATPVPCHAPGLPAAAPGGLQGGAAGGSGSGAVAGPAEGGTGLVLPAACGAARGQSSPERVGGGHDGRGPEPATPQALAAATTPTGPGSLSAAVPGVAGAPVGVPAARIAVHSTESAAAAGGLGSAAAQPDATAPAGSAAGSLSGGAPKRGAGTDLAAVPELRPGQGQGWGGNLRAAGGSPKTSRTATLGEITPPLRKFPRIHSPMVPPARERATAVAAEAKEAGAQPLLGQFGAEPSVEDVPGEMVPPARQHAAMGTSKQGLPCQPGAQAPVEGMHSDAPLPKRHSVVEAAAEGVVGRIMLPERQSAAGAAAAVGAEGAGASRDDMPLQSRREILPAGQPRAEPAAASAVEAPVGPKEGAPTELEAAQAAAVEQQGSAADSGALQGPSVGFEQPPAGRSGSAADEAARAAPGAGVVPGSEDPVGFHSGAGACADRADGRAAPGSGFGGWKRGQQGVQPAEAGMTPRTQVHPAPQPASSGPRRELRPGGSTAGRPSGIPGAPGVVGCAPPMGPGGAPGGAAVQPSIGGACGQRPGREPGSAGACSAPGGREARISCARSAPHVRGTARMGTHGALGGRGAVPMSTRRALGGRESAAPAGWHERALDGGFDPRFGPDARAGLPGGGRPCREACVPQAGSAPCMAGGPNPGQNPITGFNSRAWAHTRGGALQSGHQGRALGSTPGPRDPAPACRWPAGQHRPGTAPGHASYNRAEECPGGLAPCWDPGAAAAGAGQRGGAPVTFAEAQTDFSEQLPGPPPCQQLRQHSAPAGWRPWAHPGVQGRAQAHPPVATSRPGAAGARRTRTEHEGPYPGPGPVPHSGWMCPTPAAQLEQALSTERGAARWGHPEVGMPRAPCKRRDGAAPGAPVVPKQLMHSRSGSSQPAACRVPAMDPHPAGHAAVTRRSSGACQAEAHALEKPATRALPEERAGIRAPPDASVSAAPVTPARNARRVRREAPGADVAAPAAQATPAHGAKRVCSRAGRACVPAAAAGAAAAHQAGRSSFGAGRAGMAGAGAHARGAQEVRRACVKPHDAGRARVAVDATPGPRAKRKCSRPEAPGPCAGTGQNSRRAADVGGAACGHGRELDQAGQPDEAPPSVSPTIARLVEQVLLRIWLAEEPGQLICCI